MSDAPEPGSQPLANIRWETFCRIYAGGDEQGRYRGNGTRAYQAAGYATTSDISAAQGPIRLLREPAVKARVDFLVKQYWAKLDISQEEIIARAAAIVRFDPSKLYDEGGNWLPLHEVDEQTRMALAGIETDLFIPTATEENPAPVSIATKKVKAADKNAALRTLAQIKRMVGPEVSVTVNTSMADRLAAARKRARERNGA